MIEQGRPSMCGSSASPTASKYRARSSFVAGLPLPSSAHKGLSGFEIGTPITTEALILAVRIADSVGSDFFAGTARLPPRAVAADLDTLFFVRLLAIGFFT